MREQSTFHRTSRLLVLAAACAGFTGLLMAQGRGGGQPEGPSPNVSTDPLLRGFEFRSIGPAVMMGRVDDIQGSEKDPMIIYVGFATGGLWKSTDGGNYWHSLMDDQENESIGAIGLAPSNPDIVYVGKGESNNRQSSSIGDGVWGTTDGGKTWTHLGLTDTQAIDRIAVDPTNPNIVFVAAMGHLFGPNKERGLYRSVDGGKNWKQVKYIDDYTGFNEVAIDPSNPKIVYGTSYSRLRTWWGYNGGSTNAGMWKSTDGGDTWKRIEGGGWPVAKDGLYGRIAISIFKARPSTIYAQIEVGASAGTGGGTAADGGPQLPGAGRGGAGAPGGAAGAAPDAAAGGGGGGGRGRGGPPPPPDPNGSGVYRSDDGGATWKLMSNQNDRPMYFSQIRVDPKDDQKIMTGGNPGRMSHDGGKTWTNMTGSHTDYHAFWINPVDPRIVWIGHDGGLDSSNDGGVTWDYHNDIAVGQFYQVSADMRRPYWVCGGLQDNNAWCGPSALRASNGPTNGDWYTVAGGDGFYTRQDPTDWAIVYGESQDGNMTRHDLRNGTQKSIRPNAGNGRGGAAQGQAAAAPAAPAAGQPAEGGQPAAAANAGRGGGGGGRGGTPNVLNAPANVEPLRFYWNAPIEISPHNPEKIYMAAQYFFKSTNRGDTWTMNPTDLSKNVNRWAPEQVIMGVAGDKPMASKHDGYAASSLSTQIRESPSKPGVIWIGTDDGNLQVSQDDGDTFTNVASYILATSGAPKAPHGWVQIARIEPSHFDPATCYVALDNHRNDDWKPYLFKTTNYGKSWVNVTANLPAKGNVNAVREDYDNPNLLFVGTEFGLFVSLDGSKTYQKFMTNLPSVRVDDILIHPRDRDLIVATHGRSIWICDDISPLEQLKTNSTSDLTLFAPRPAVQWKNDLEKSRSVANRDFHGRNPQGGTAIHILAKGDLGAGKLEFLQGTTVVSEMNVDIKTGMNHFQWGMQRLNQGGNTNGRGGRGGAGAAATDTAAAGGANAAGGGGGRRAGRGGAGDTAAAGADAAQAAGGGPGGGGRGGRGGAGGGVPFVSRGGGGGFGGGGGGGPLEPGVYMVRLVVGDKTVTSSVNVLEDIWARPQ